MFWTRNPATIAMVVGKLAAQTPSFFRVFSSMFEATTNGGAHCKNTRCYSFCLIEQNMVLEIFNSIYNQNMYSIKILTAKQAVSPGTRNWMWPETAFSETPDSNQIWLISLQAAFIAILASKLSTQLRTTSTGPPDKLPSLEKDQIIEFRVKLLWYWSLFE